VLTSVLSYVLSVYFAAACVTFLNVLRTFTCLLPAPKCRV
jgi:hypothetical protein